VPCSAEFLENAAEFHNAVKGVEFSKLSHVLHILNITRADKQIVLCMFDFCDMSKRYYIALYDV